jgi:anti-sigma factor RsiW
MSERQDFGKAVTDSLPVYEAPPALEAWALQQARAVDQDSIRYVVSRKSSPAARRWKFHDWRLAAGLLIAAAVGWAASSTRDASRFPVPAAQTADQLVDAHVRSLLPNHLLDVVSTDRHTVKPWFAGKTDIAPPVVDLSDKGFPLLGGRLDYVDGHSAAVLVYGRRLHTINVFVWRATGDDARDGAFAVRGHSLLHWTNAGLSYWAVSDAAPSELEAFREAYTQ